MTSGRIRGLIAAPIVFIGGILLALLRAIFGFRSWICRVSFNFPKGPWFRGLLRRSYETNLRE